MSGLLSQGLDAHRQGRFQEAEERYRQAMLTGGEEGTEGQFLCGTLLLQLGRLQESIGLLSQSAEGRPNDYRPWLNLGEALRLAGRQEEAVKAAKHALLLAPGLPAAHLLQGNLDRVAGRSLDALRHYRQALKGEPSLESAWINSVSLLLELGKAQEACDEARAGLTFCSSPTLKKLLGRALFSLGEGVAAIDAFVQAGDAESLVMAALIRHDEGKDEEAHHFFRMALEVDPRSAPARYNRARVFREEKKLDEAVADLRICIEHHPDYRPALGLAAELMPLVGDFSGLDMVRGRILALGVDDGEMAATSFQMLCLVDDPAFQLASAKRASRDLPRGHAATRIIGGDGKRLTIGYLSSDFVDHALSRVMAGILEQHDRESFKIIAYATRTDDGSDISRRIRGAVEVLRDVAGMSHQAVASLIAQDGVDILVDLNGHTLGSMLDVLGYRPAPVQATYMGYPGTTGCGAVDYLIADGFVIPPEAEKYYSEAVVRLPHCYWAPDGRPAEAQSLSRKDCGLPEDGFVFACFNRANKFSSEMVGVWLSILADVPKSVLWLVAEHPSLQASLRERAKGAGIPPERLVFSAPTAYSRYLGRLALVDLFLDTYPYNAHTLAFDALRLGTPILTLCGQSFAARVAGSMLNALGLPELITHDRETYHQQAVSLARDTVLLQSLRRRLDEARRATPVFDPEVFTRHLEDAYRMMWQRARESQEVTLIEVPERGAASGG